MFWVATLRTLTPMIDTTHLRARTHTIYKALFRHSYLYLLLFKASLLLPHPLQIRERERERTQNTLFAIAAKFPLSYTNCYPPFVVFASPQPYSASKSASPTSLERFALLLWPLLMETGAHGFEFHATSSQVISSDGEVWIGSGSFDNPLRRTSGPIMQHSTQRRKRQNCGNSIQGHHNTVFGSTGQREFDSNLTMAAEENLSHCSGPMFAGVRGVMNQGNRPNTRNLQPSGSEAGNSHFMGLSLNDGRSATDTCWNTVLPGSEERPSLHSGSRRAATDLCWNTVLPSSEERPSQCSGSIFVGSLTNNLYPFVGNESQNSYKRKSFMDSSGGSLTYRAACGQRESNYVRFTQGSGTQRSETSMFPVCDESSHDADQCFRTSSTHHAQIERANRFVGIHTSRTRGSYHSPSIIHNERQLLAGLPSQAPIPRRMLTSEPTNESAPETLSFRQGNGLSATDTWRANNTFLEEANIQSGFVETARTFNSRGDGYQPRHNLSEASNTIGISSVDTRPLQPPSRGSRAAPFRGFTSHASHSFHHLTPNPYVYGSTIDLQSPALSAAQPSSRFNHFHPQGGLLMFPPPGSAAAFNSMTSGPQATFGDAYPSIATMPGPAMTPVLPRFSDINRASHLRQVSLRGPRAPPSEGMHRHRFAASHELFNQNLVYSDVDWVDIHDEHSSMRLDVDNMSYEELLALEERIGNVNAGLSEDDVHKCLKTSTHSCSDATAKSQESDLKCSICQEEYMEGDGLGQLECGHGYHTACIRLWLLLKNQCPICKAAAGSKA